MAAISAEGVSFRYSQLNSPPTLLDVTFSLSEQEVLCIVGPSGCGKSTLLNIIAGILSPAKGRIDVLGRINQRDANQAIGYIRQSPAMLPYRSLWSNAALGLELRKSRLDPIVLGDLGSLLKALGLEKFAAYHPSELSQGMNQRVAIARELILSPRLILADEPLSALDFDTRLSAEDLFWMKCKALQAACVFVTHHLDTAVSLGDRVLVMTRNPGSILAEVEIPSLLRAMSPSRRRDHELFAQLQARIWDRLKSSNIQEAVN